MLSFIELSLLFPSRLRAALPRQNASACPMFQSLDMRNRSRRNPCYLAAIFAHFLVIGLIFLQIARGTPILSEAGASLRAISLICPAARQKQHQAERNDARLQQSSEQPLQSPVAERPRIQLATMAEAPAPEPIADMEWSNEMMQAVPSGLRGGARVQVSLAVPSASSSGVNTAGSSHGDAQTSAGNSSQNQNSWEARLMGRLSQFRRYPDSARKRHEEGVVYLRFRMDHAGKVLSSHVERSYGHVALDQEALVTLRRAQPLPAPPADRPAILDLLLPIEFYLR